MLVEDHIVLREGLRRSLEANGVSVVAEVGDGNEVLLPPDSANPMSCSWTSRCQVRMGLPPPVS